MTATAITPTVQSELISVTLDGPLVGDTYPFQDVVRVLGAVDSLFETAARSGDVLAIDRRQAKIVAGFPRRGSYHIDIQFLGFIVSTIASQLGGPSITDRVLEKAKAYFEILKALFSNREERPTVQMDRNSGVVINAHNNTAPITVNVNLLKEAASSAQELEEILTRLGIGDISSVSFRSSKSKAEFQVTKADADLLTLPSAERRARIKLLKDAVRELEAGHLLANEEQMRRTEKPMTLAGEILAFDRKTRKGMFEALENADLPDGRYKFIVEGEQDTRPYVVAMLQKIVHITCVPEWSSKKPSRVALLHLLSVETAKTIGA